MDLPLPFGPRRPYRSPSRTSRLTSRTASTLPKRLVRSRVVINGQILIRFGGQHRARSLEGGLADQPDQQERVGRAVWVDEDEVDKRSARDRAGSVVIRQRRRARVKRVAEQLPADAAAEGEHGERGQPAAEHADLRDGRRLPREPGEAAGKHLVVQVLQHAVEAGWRGGGEPGARPALRGQHTGVGCPRARLKELGFQRRLGRAAVEDLHEQRQPGSR